MIRNALCILAFIVALELGVQAQQNLELQITGIDLERGNTLAVTLYASSESYEDREPFFAELYQDISNPFTISIEDVPPGELMILGLQDSNGNLEMDTGVFGMPKEGYFCSQNASRPSWQHCAFSYDGGSSIVRLEMIYW